MPRVVKLVAGLGNPGDAYRRTRHNAGFMAVEALAGPGARWRRSWWRSIRWAESAGVRVAEPLAFMNRSGGPLAGLMRRMGIRPSELLVVYDDLSLELGRIRIRTGGRAGGHNGLQSVIDALGTEAVPRLRMGIGRPPAGMDQVAYVLHAFGDEEQPRAEAMVQTAADAVRRIVTEGLEAAMNQYNGMK